jgi:hypothetical protein
MIGCVMPVRKRTIGSFRFHIAMCHELAWSCSGATRFGNSTSRDVLASSHKHIGQSSKRWSIRALRRQGAQPPLTALMQFVESRTRGLFSYSLGCAFRKHRAQRRPSKQFCGLPPPCPNARDGENRRHYDAVEQQHPMDRRLSTPYERPPSTDRIWPDIQDAWSLARKRTALAISSARPSRRVWIDSTSRLCPSGP